MAMSRVAIMGECFEPESGNEKLLELAIASNCCKRFSKKKPGRKCVMSPVTSSSRCSTSCKPLIGPTPEANWAPIDDRFTTREIWLVRMAMAAALPRRFWKARTSSEP